MELRSLDELEGTLLPVAVPIHASSASTSAVPLARFRYDDASMQRDDDDHHDRMSSMAADIQDAPLIPQCDDPRSRERQIAQALAKANQIGVVKAEIDREALERASRDMHAKNHYNKLLLEEANKIAQRKTWQDDANYDFLNVKSRPESWTKNEGSEQQPPQQEVNGAGGYEVSEYEVKEYKGDDDYHISEYKSVYDP